MLGVRGLVPRKKREMGDWGPGSSPPPPPELTNRLILGRGRELDSYCIPKMPHSHRAKQGISGYETAKAHNICSVLHQEVIRTENVSKSLVTDPECYRLHVRILYFAS